MFVMTVFTAILFATTAASLCWISTRNLAIVIIAAAVTFSMVMFLAQSFVLKRRKIVVNETREPLEDHLFMEKWVLDLSVPVPKVNIIDVSMVKLCQQLRGYYETAQTAVKYFSEGKYCIRCDGTMRKLTDTEAAELHGHTHVVAKIYFEDLPFPEVMAHRLTNKPSNILERGLNCALVDVCAYSTAKRGSSEGGPCMLVFAARNGELIVESLT